MGSAYNGVSRRAFPANVEVSGLLGEKQELHVLAVDDSLVDRKVIERLLRISSCKVTAVESAGRALQYLGLLDGERTSNGQNKLKVNLIITDYSMPGMTGYELMKKIKESSTLSEIPVVIMSSENILARIDRCLEEGAKDYIVKPVKLSDVRRIKDLVKGSLGKPNISTKQGLSEFVSLASIARSPVSKSQGEERKCQSPRCVVRLRRHDHRS